MEESGDGGSFDDVDKMLKESSAVGQLEKNLQVINFKNVEDVSDSVDGFYCDLCFSGSEPNWKSLPKIAAGAFKYTKAEKKKAQSLNLSHLKGNIKGHVGTKLQGQKKLILENVET